MGLCCIYLRHLIVVLLDLVSTVDVLICRLIAYVDFGGGL